MFSMPTSFQPFVEESQRQTEAIFKLAALFGLPQAEVQARLQKYIATDHPELSWEEAYHRILRRQSWD
jgi:hypothetical protein